MRNSGVAGAISGLACAVDGQVREQRFAAGFRAEKPGEIQNFGAEWAGWCPILLCASMPRAGIRHRIRGRLCRTPGLAIAKPGLAIARPRPAAAESVSEGADDVIAHPSC